MARTDTLDAPYQQATDELLCRKVRRALRDSGYHEFRHIRVSADGGQVCLAGRVSSYHLKQLAQAVTLSIAGAHSLENMLAVTSH